MKKLLRTIGFIWLLPMTLIVWLFYVLPLMWKDLKFVGWADLFVAHFTVKSKHSWYAKVWREWLGWSGPCVVVTRDAVEEWPELPSSEIEKANQRTLKHELRHANQQFVFGPLHYPLYGLMSLWIWFFVKWKHAYLDNPFERDARKAAGQRVNVPPDLWPKGPKDRWPWW